MQMAGQRRRCAVVFNDGKPRGPRISPLTFSVTHKLDEMTPVNGLRDEAYQFFEMEAVLFVC